MKRCLLAILIMFSIMQLSAVYASDVLDSGAGARQIGLGKAFTSVVGDSSSIFVNPAGISGISTLEITSMYGQLSGEIVYNKTGVVIPTKIGVFGIGYASSRAGNIYSTTIEASGRVGLSSTFGYEDSVLLMSYGNSLDKNNRLRYGVNIKYYTKGSGDIAGGRGTGMNADLGLDYDLNKMVRAGLVVRNIFVGDLGSIKWDNNANEGLPLTAGAGLLMKLRENLTMTLDLNTRENNELEESTGLELAPNNNLAIRFGAERKPAGGGASYVNLSAGVGLKIKDAIKIDYAYYYDSLLPDNSRSFISFSLSFNSAAKTGRKP